MTTLTKLQRFSAAVRGEPVDRPPVGAWVHFASEHLPASEVARLHVAFHRAYDFDFVKVMNDYRFPLPEGVRAVAARDDLLRIRPASLDAPHLAEQLACLREIRGAVGPDVPLIETLFDPLQTLVRASGASAREVVFANPDAGHAALEAITRSLIGYIGALKDLRVNGLFYSVNGAVRPDKGGLTDAQFAEFVAPYDARILAAAEGLTRIAHVHGFDLAFERCAAYPVEVFSWSHLRSAPTLAEARAMTRAAVMGGMDETAVARQSVIELAADIRRSAAEAGLRGFIVAPGCTFPPDTPSRMFHAAVATARTLRP